MITRQEEQIIVNRWAALLRDLKQEIRDDYRCTDDPEDTTPGMLVTFGLSADGDWSYQTGDNSFIGARTDTRTGALRTCIGAAIAKPWPKKHSMTR